MPKVLTLNTLQNIVLGNNSVTSLQTFTVLISLELLRGDLPTANFLISHHTTYLYFNETI